MAQSSLLPFDWRHYIGHFLGAFVLAVYGCIFYYIYQDGAFDRAMQRRGREARAQGAGDATAAQKDRNSSNRNNKKDQ